MRPNTLVIGGAGNVGKGIVQAFDKKGWQTKIIDPKVNQSFEETTNNKLRNLLKRPPIIVYCADIGNRDEYEKQKGLEKRNSKRFSDFCLRVTSIKPNVVIWYVGGSWTKRKPSAKWVVNDNSPNKAIAKCNAYEKAKIEAEKNSQRLSEKIKIRFIDWISIIPNLSDNFSIPDMVRQAAGNGIIKYSPGPYGRPLLEATNSGEALVKLIKADDQEKAFNKYLISGEFVRFELFAEAAKKAAENRLKREVKLKKLSKTPEFLKSKVHSDYLKRLGFKPDGTRVVKALEQNANIYLENYLSNS